MSVRQAPYRKWEQAYEIVSGDRKMVVVTEIGPRILSLTLGDGPNLLFDDERERIGAGDWRIYGGHRFWAGPETPLTYAPDNAPCEAKIEDDGLTVVSPIDPTTRLRKILRVEPAEDGFFVNHVLENCGDFLAPPAAVWGLTCVRPTGVCAIPWRGGVPGWSVASIKLWAQWADHSTDVVSDQWRPTTDLYEVHPTGEEGKIGTFADRGWVAQWTDEATFIKAAEAYDGATYPDDGCNVELYTCDRFIELETLSPMATLRPGEPLDHEEQWIVVEPIPRSFEAVEGVLFEEQ